MARKYARGTSKKGRKPNAKRNQNQIVAIKKHLSLSKERLRWHCGFSETPMVNYPVIIPLTSGPSTTNPAQTNTNVSCVWNATMTPSPQDLDTFRSKVCVNTQWVDLSITGGTEPSATYFTAFLVQLQDKTATQVYAETSSMSTLTRNVDFVTPLNSLNADSGYGAYLNNSRFKIIKRLEFSTLGPTLGWPGGPPGNDGPGLGAALRRTQFKINYGNTVMKSSGNGSSLNTLEYAEIDPSKKRFIVIFNDNNLIDGEYPNVAMSSLVTGYALE